MSAAATRVARLDDVPPGPWERPVEWLPLRHHLGISAFGVNAWRGDAGAEVIEEHDEQEDGRGHEEIYLVVRGRATFTVGGQTIDAPAGTAVAISDPAAVRKAVTSEDGTLILAVGAPRGAAFEVSRWEARRLG